LIPCPLPFAGGLQTTARRKVKAIKTPAATPEVTTTGSWTLSQEPGGLWSAMIHLNGEWLPLGYFGARGDAEATIAACLRPARPEPTLVEQTLEAIAKLGPG
jgi:hypothetical protein